MHGGSAECITDGLDVVKRQLAAAQLHGLCAGEARRGGNKRLDVDIRAAQVKLRGGGVKALARKLHLAEEAYVGERVYQRVFLVVAESGGAEIDAFKLREILQARFQLAERCRRIEHELRCVARVGRAAQLHLIFDGAVRVGVDGFHYNVIAVGVRRVDGLELRQIAEAVYLGLAVIVNADGGGAAVKAAAAYRHVPEDHAVREAGAQLIVFRNADLAAAQVNRVALPVELAADEHAVGFDPEQRYHRRQHKNRQYKTHDEGRLALFPRAPYMGFSLLYSCRMAVLPARLAFMGCHMCLLLPANGYNYHIISIAQCIRNFKEAQQFAQFWTVNIGLQYQIIICIIYMAWQYHRCRSNLTACAALHDSAPYSINKEEYQFP